MRVGVIGTGVAGSLLTEGLLAVPAIAVTAFERAGPDAHGEAGTGLNVGPNALRALRLYLPGRHAALRAASLPWRRWTVALADGTPLLDLDVDGLAGEPGARLRWSELYRVLRAPIAAATRYGLTLAALEEDAAGRLVPVFSDPDGDLVRDGGFDLLVGADGRYSRMRALAAGEPAVAFMGTCLWRLLVPDAADCPFDDYGQWFNGPNRLLAFRLPRGASYVAGAVPLGSDGESPPRLRTPAAQRALFEPAGASPCVAVAWMLEQIVRRFGDLHWARMQSISLLRRALDDRVLLLGDAAHAMVPTLGQGATQAVEDGVLAAAVLRAGGTPADVATLRDERVRFVQALSLAASDTMRPGTDIVAGTLAKGGPEFLDALRRLWTDVPAQIDVRAR